MAKVGNVGNQKPIQHQKSPDCRKVLRNVKGGLQRNLEVCKGLQRSVEDCGEEYRREEVCGEEYGGEEDCGEEDCGQEDCRGQRRM